MAFFIPGKKIHLICILLIAIYLSACSYKEGLFPQKDIDGNFEISIPDFMSSTKRLSDESNFQYQNRFRTIYKVVVYEKVSETNHSFSSYVTKNITIFENSIDSLLTHTKVELEINGLNAIQYKADVILTGQGFYYMLTFIESDDAFYQVANWTNHKRKKDYEPLFDEMILTFKVLD